MHKTASAGLLTLIAAGLCSCGTATFSNYGGGQSDLEFRGPSAVLDQSISVGALGAVVQLHPEGNRLAVLVTGLNGAKAVYGQLRYDPSAQHVVDIQPAASGPDALVLINDDPGNGQVDFGWVLPNFDLRQGVEGELRIGNVTFASGAAAQKVSLKAPLGSGNAIELSAELDGSNMAHLTWLESLQGDGDNNGDVNISDLTPLGISFGKTPGSGAADSQARDADYDKNGEVNISDITPLGLNLGTSLGGYMVLAGPASDNLSDYDDFARTEMFPGTLNAASGELTWDWTDTVELAEDTYFAVIPYDSAGPATRGLQSNAVQLIAPNPTQTVSDVTIELPSGVNLDQDGSGDYIVILTENSVDGTAGNAEPLDGVVESLQLTAMVDTLEDPGNVFDGTSLVVWRLTDGGGLANVGNGGTVQKGLLSFVDRGRIEIEAHAVGNFAVKDTLGFKLYSIQEIQLAATPGGAGPVSVAAGAGVGFTATGIFDFDGTSNGNEVSADITPYVGWGMVPDGGNAGSFSFDTGASSLTTADASSGDGVRVAAEFPRTDEVTLYNNLRVGSNFVRVDIN